MNSAIQSALVFGGPREHGADGDQGQRHRCIQIACVRLRAQDDAACPDRDHGGADRRTAPRDDEAEQSQGHEDEN